MQKNFQKNILIIFLFIIFYVLFSNNITHCFVDESNTLKFLVSSITNLISEGDTTEIFKQKFDKFLLKSYGENSIIKGLNHSSILKDNLYLSELIDLAIKDIAQNPLKSTEVLETLTSIKTDLRTQFYIDIVLIILIIPAFLVLMPSARGLPVDL